jgi:queuine tRNA-ribosyltransferase
LEDLGYQLVLSNTYHLHLRPGEERIERLGGLHKFMSWPGSLLTDSGGYQVFSLSDLNEISDEGVRFRSHLDGDEIFLTPEKSIQIQRALGVDIAMALDDCPPYPCTREQAAAASRRTHAWAPRNLEAAEGIQAVFGISQGSVFEDLRVESAQRIASLPFAGCAIGGVSVGEPVEAMRMAVETASPHLPEQKPRYLMGVGHPADILHAVRHGIDLFDCVLPTRMARHHTLYTLQGRIKIAGAEWADHAGPPDPLSVSPVFERYSAAYLRHLFKVGEFLAMRLATLHNLWFYSRLMAEIREAIERGTMPELAARYADA